MRFGAIRHNPAVRRTTDLILKVVPTAVLVSVAAIMAAQQAIDPSRRVIKLSVLMGLMALMLRFDMAYSVYLFTIVFPFPSSVSIGSTNSILMTIIPLIWAIRSSSTKSKFIVHRTKVDFAIGLFLLVSVLSLINVENTLELTSGIRILWRTFATVAYFYMIVFFIDDEKKIVRLTKVLCAVCGLVMITAVIELFAPGRSIIPGWIGFTPTGGGGEFSRRIEGIRVGGAFGSHGVLSDFGTQMLFLMMYHIYRSRNYAEKLFWGGVAVVTVIALFSTANRGAFLGFVVGLAYFLFLFRNRMSLTQIVVILAVVAGMFALTETLLTRYTYATSLSARLLSTEMKGFVPENRVGTWEPALKGGLEHPLVGHGPYYQIRKGVERQMWPHNAYIFYFYTIGSLGLLAFLAVVFGVWKYSLAFKRPGLSGTTLGDISKILHVVLVVFLIEQLRTDHQRDDIYPFIMWMWFGLITTTALVIGDKYGASSGEGGRGRQGGVDDAPDDAPDSAPEAAGDGENGRKRTFRRWRGGRLRS